MGHHFIEKCKECDAVISQCRCMGKNKEVRYGICNKCIQPHRHGVEDQDGEDDYFCTTKNCPENNSTRCSAIGNYRNECPNRRHKEQEGEKLKRYSIGTVGKMASYVRDDGGQYCLFREAKKQIADLQDKLTRAEVLNDTLADRNVLLAQSVGDLQLLNRKMSEGK